ncbi:hypothetical protein HYH03_017419 [Edaphochlamys debaryana]|uniref:Uncharacterized protein n=1 Tax=Edaphochlamys debaryana TaxID=47281 RepID=A0A835XJ12_9CHLO|nr:hypothetical protein HYH03_017419 [Edaphochlamys debaryana]|eukprot:KAG2483698.1 hypothetical protein HYH03_017419 [Edaphochlamys debaryana]
MARSGSCTPLPWMDYRVYLNATFCPGSLSDDIATYMQPAAQRVGLRLAAGALCLEDGRGGQLCRGPSDGQRRRTEP